MKFLNLKQENPTTVEPTKKILKPSEIVMEWEAPERFFEKKSRDFYRKIAVIAIFFSILLIIFLNIVLVIVIWVAFGLYYVATTIPPKNVVHRITTNGIDYASNYTYRWEDLSSFYITDRKDQKVLVLTTVNSIPGSLYLILANNMDVQKLSMIINEHVSIDENPQPTFYEGLMAKIGTKIKI